MTCKKSDYDFIDAKEAINMIQNIGLENLAFVFIIDKNGDLVRLKSTRTQETPPDCTRNETVKELFDEETKRVICIRDINSVTITECSRVGGDYVCHEYTIPL